MTMVTLSETKQNVTKIPAPLESWCIRCRRTEVYLDCWQALQIGDPEAHKVIYLIIDWLGNTHLLSASSLTRCLVAVHRLRCADLYQVRRVQDERGRGHSIRGQILCADLAL